MSGIKIKIFPDFTPRWSRELSTEDDIFIPRMRDPSYGPQLESLVDTTGVFALEIGRVSLLHISQTPTDLDDPINLLVLSTRKPPYERVSSAA